MDYEFSDTIKESWLAVFDDALKEQGLSEFWRSHYPDADRVDLAERVLSFAVVIVETHKRFDDARKKGKGE